jgi:hypothetical protein
MKNDLVIHIAHRVIKIFLRIVRFLRLEAFMLLSTCTVQSNTKHFIIIIIVVVVIALFLTICLAELS